MHERRKQPRNRSLLGGRVSFDGGRSALDCAVRSVSPNGATVVHSELFRMPGEFVLAIPHRAERHQAKVIWRDGDTAGLRLSPVADPSARVERTQRAPRKIWLQGSRRPANKVFDLGY